MNIVLGGTYIYPLSSLNSNLSTYSGSISVFQKFTTKKCKKINMNAIFLYPKICELLWDSIDKIGDPEYYESCGNGKCRTATVESIK